MNSCSEQDFKELLYSLAWSNWSSYHSQNARYLMTKMYPGLDAHSALNDFQKIIAAPAGPGSPK